MYQKIKNTLIEYYKNSNWKVSDRFEAEPNLGIDLICTRIEKSKITEKKDNGKSEEIIFILIGSKINKSYKTKLLFYQYYLSIDISSELLYVIFAIPYTNIKRSELDFFKNNGVGLLMLKKKDSDKLEVVEKIPTKTLRSRMEDDIERMIIEYSEEYEKGNKSIKNQDRLTKENFDFFKSHKNIIATLSDKFIEDAVTGIVGLTEIKEKTNEKEKKNGEVKKAKILKFEKKYLIEFDKKYIDTKLMELTLNINGNIPFSSLLVKKINSQCFEKGDEFDFCNNIFQMLWKKNFKMEYYKEFKINDQVLKYFFPKYRDHFIHQFQDYLLGLLLISNLINGDNVKELSKAWLLASSLHDFSYPIQKYDDVAQKLTSGYFSSGMPISFLSLKDKYMEDELYAYVEYFIDHIKDSFCPAFQKKGTECINKIRKFVYKKITEKRNHGAIGYLALISKFENKDKQKSLFKNIVLPSGVGIFLHDDEIWQPLCGMEDDNNMEDYIREVNELKPLPNIEYEKHPIIFIMILVDNIQDWGRHYIDEEFERGVKAANISFGGLSIKSDKIEIKLFYDDIPDSHDFIGRKINLLKKIEKYLSSSNKVFEIQYWRRNENKIAYKFTIDKKTATK